VFLYYFANLIRAKRILDLGSGFSSFAFGKYLRNVGSGVLSSVDTSEFWLNETSEFLRKYEIAIAHMCTLDQYLNVESETEVPDLCFLDIGDLELREQLLPSLLSNVVRHGMVLLIDDFHVPSYRRMITRLCTEADLQCLSLRKVTRRRLSHMAMVIKKK
jgi:predicted O-methyltransferase YrrM